MILISSYNAKGISHGHFQLPCISYDSSIQQLSKSSGTSQRYTTCRQSHCKADGTGIRSLPVYPEPARRCPDHLRRTGPAPDFLPGPKRRYAPSVSVRSERSEERTCPPWHFQFDVQISVRSDLWFQSAVSQYHLRDLPRLL